MWRICHFVGIESLLDENNKLDMIISERFPIREVIANGDISTIKGSSNVVSLCNALNVKKYDLIESFSNIKYIGINNQKEVVLEFPNQNIKASGIYDFSKKFYDKFKMASFAKMCIRDNMHDLVQRNINEMLTEFKRQQNQYRFLIEDEQKYYLRALTSRNYKNYDNNIAIYSIIYALEKLAEEENEIYYVSNGWLGDSTMNLLLTNESNIEIPEVCKIKFSLNISNSEIADESLKVCLRYVVTDKARRTFSAMVEKPLCRLPILCTSILLKIGLMKF